MRFQQEKLSEKEIEKLENLRKECIRDILTMTTLANSGHPGGSISSLDIYLIVFSYSNISPSKIDDPERDKIVISHGHTSPGIYSTLGRLGFFDIDIAISTFRKTGSIFEGHIVRKVPGIEWGTGNLGQGLSAGCGFALADKLHNRNSYTFVLMSDGEQTKGQVSEARRFAIKYKLNRLKVIIDYNKVQISGKTDDIMPCRIKENYLSDGWEVIECDGHNYQELYTSIRKSILIDKPVCIIAHTIMGKGISFMENEYKYHGKPLTEQEYLRAMEEIGLEPVIEKYKNLREKEWKYPERKFYFSPKINLGNPIVYSKEEKTDNRTAYGKSLLDIAKANRDNKEYPIVVFDCDLASSVKTDLFEKEFPERFFQVGVQEHNAATISGAISTDKFITFFSDFGVFGVDETFNQQRLNDQNFTNLKLVCTHLGLDVGEDGKTHQCIDYIGVLRNLFGFKIIIPADPNQTDRVIRYIVDKQGNWFVGMGRSRIPIILKENGEVFFDENYKFEYGKADIIREGKDGYILTYGCMVYRAIKVYEELKKEGITIGVMNFSCPTVIDQEKIKIAINTGFLITYEDHHIDTGLGATISIYLAENGIKVKFLRCGIKNYGASGNPDELFKKQGLSPEDLVDIIKYFIKKE
ncbi:MAG: transketolase [Candidatus Omnitrophica bacterium]|nr:transketolase [Candidatus Omnitrophota bacterium]